MSLSSILKSSLAITCLACASLPAAAMVVTANTGWVSDELASPGAATDGSPYTFSLSAGQVGSFKLTDAFIPGDSFSLFLGSTLLIDSTAYVGSNNAIDGDSTGESSWMNAAYEKFEYIFDVAGDYSLIARGDGFAGTPAGLYIRLDVTTQAVPEPGSLALLGLGLAGLAAIRKRKQA